MPREVKKKGNTMVEANSPVSRVNLAIREYSIHLGPFMPMNSGAPPITTGHSNQVVKTDSAVRIGPPKRP